MTEFYYEVTCNGSIVGRNALAKIYQKLAEYGEHKPVELQSGTRHRVFSIYLKECFTSADVEEKIRADGLEVRVADPDEFR